MARSTPERHSAHFLTGLSWSSNLIAFACHRINSPPLFLSLHDVASPSHHHHRQQQQLLRVIIIIIIIVIFSTTAESWTQSTGRGANQSPRNLIMTRHVCAAASEELR